MVASGLGSNANNSKRLVLSLEVRNNIMANEFEGNPACFRLGALEKDDNSSGMYLSIIDCRHRREKVCIGDFKLTNKFIFL
jgi:hypothetical protein